MRTWSEILKTGILYPVRSWERGAPDKKWSQVRDSSELFDQDRDYDYYLTRNDEGYSGKPKPSKNPNYDQGGSHRAWAIHRPTGLVHGVMSWESGGRMVGKKGVITGVSTHPDYRRQGIATNLLRKTQEAATDLKVSTPRHSSSMDRTTDGDLWVAGLGEDDWNEGEGR